MKNTEETKRSFSFSVEWGKLRERGKARKRRMLRQIELMRLRRIRQQNVPQYTYCKNCGTKLEGMYCYQCGQYALDPRHLSGNILSSILKMYISTTARCGVRCG